jgi:hypothetical protein
MEATGVPLRQTPKISGGILNERSVFVSNPSSVAMVRGFRNVKRLRVRATAMDIGFEDKASLMYYYGNCRTTTEERKKEIKNRLKVLSKDLIKLPITPDFTQSQVNTIKEATEILQMQLQQLKAEEKVLKKQRKAEEKATRMKKKMTGLGCESSSSSSSSESTDSDCGKDMANAARLRTAQNEFPAILEATTTLTLPISTTPPVDSMTKRNVCTNYTNSVSSMTDINMSTKRIEVCMGNKCKKSGSAALLEEFTRVTGVEATVVGCKCMGKCRDGPNVRVLNSVDGLDDSLRTPPKSLCNRVGLEDVGVIVSNLGCYVDNGKGLVLPPPLA